MPVIKIKGSDREIQAKVGDNLLELAKKQNLGIVFRCNGAPSCALCRVVIDSGEEHLSEYCRKEEDLLGSCYYITKQRLCCQTTIISDGEIVLDLGEHESYEQRKRARDKARIKLSEKERIEAKERREEQMKRLEAERKDRMKKYDLAEDSDEDNETSDDAPSSNDTPPQQQSENREDESGNHSSSDNKRRRKRRRGGRGRNRNKNNNNNSPDNNNNNNSPDAAN